MIKGEATNRLNCVEIGTEYILHKNLNKQQIRDNFVHFDDIGEKRGRWQYWPLT